MTREPWWDRGACNSSAAADVFYPEKGERTAAAKRVCARCPVQAPCLRYALKNRERFGVWGGKDERERRRLLAA